LPLFMSCREEEFSETRLQVIERLCAKGSKTPRSRSLKLRMLPQDVVVLDGYAGSRLSPGPIRIIQRRCVSEYTVVTLLDRGAAASVQGGYAMIHLLRSRHRALTRINNYGLDQGRGACPNT
jgi:hypothetical protein